MTNCVLFFDGCHKIYFAEASDQDTIEKMNGYGYETITPENFGRELRELWASSCSLRFVQHAAFDPKAPQVYQFQKGGLRGFLTDLKQYLVFMEAVHEKHEQIRSALIDSGSPEFGDAIIDRICELFDYPTTSHKEQK